MDLSIIIPTYNRRDWLKKAVESCLAISKIDVEIIVVDDGSNDGTELIVFDDDRVKVFRQNKRGGNAARNLGIQHASGEYIKFLDDDDLVIATGVEQQFLISKQDSISVSYGNFYVIDETGKKPLTKRIVKKQVDDALVEILSHWSNAPFSYLIHRSYLNLCSWDESLKGLQDFDFILKIAEQNYMFKYIDCDIGFYRIHNRPSVMKENPLIRTHAMLRVLDNSYDRLKQADRLGNDLKNAFALGYYRTLRLLFQMDIKEYHIRKEFIYKLSPNFIPMKYVKTIDTVGVAFFGLYGYEKLLGCRRRLKKYVVDRLRF